MDRGTLTEGPSFGCRCFQLNAMSSEVTAQLKEGLKAIVLNFEFGLCLWVITLEDEDEGEHVGELVDVDEDGIGLQGCQMDLAYRRYFESLGVP